jgi:methionyl-tRNA formyltransferase
VKIGIVGRTHILLQTAERLLAKGHEIVFVHTCRAEDYYQAREADFEKLAGRIGCEFFNDTRIHERVDHLASLGAEVCVSFNWLTLLRDRFLGRFRHGVLNAHAGDLPRYKGNACPNWAILDFEQQIALTVHRMTEDLDSGPFLIKRYLPIDERTYIGEIYDWLEQIVPEAFVEAIEQIPRGGFIEQSRDVVTLRTYPRKPEDSRIRWADSARDIVALVRASSRPFAGAFCQFDGLAGPLIIWRASVHPVDFEWRAVPGQVCFRAGDNPVIATGGGMLEIEECSFAHDTTVDAKATILKSLRNRLI